MQIAIDNEYGRKGRGRLSSTAVFQHYSYISVHQCIAVNIDFKLYVLLFAAMIKYYLCIVLYMYHTINIMVKWNTSD